MERKKYNYGHEKVKEGTQFWVAAIWAHWLKLSIGQKCKEASCTLHPNYNCKCNRISKVLCGLAQTKHRRKRKRWAICFWVHINATNKQTVPANNQNGGTSLLTSAVLNRWKSKIKIIFARNIFRSRLLIFCEFCWFKGSKMVPQNLIYRYLFWNICIIYQFWFQFFLIRGFSKHFAQHPFLISILSFHDWWS